MSNFKNQTMDFYDGETPHIQIDSGENAGIIIDNPKAFGEEIAKRWNDHEEFRYITTELIKACTSMSLTHPRSLETKEIRDLLNRARKLLKGDE